MNPERCSQQELAAIHGVSTSLVRRWTRNGMPRNADGSYHAAATIDWRMARVAQGPPLVLYTERPD